MQSTSGELRPVQTTANSCGGTPRGYLRVAAYLASSLRCSTQSSGRSRAVRRVALSGANENRYYEDAGRLPRNR